MLHASRSLRLALWTCTALSPMPLLAQATPSAPPAPAAARPGASVQSSQDTQEQVEISAPGVSSDGGEIVVRGRYIPEPVRATPQVVSVLSSAEIARAGDGDIAGALTRVTGLSVVGNGFVYVRGLGDRYSSALLNGLPLPSPEPLKRVVPLDLFPTSVISSAVVQKSYSANYPGEFGGGVINLTTPAVPNKAFFNIGASIGYDTQTTNNLGYTYYGSRTDYFGFSKSGRDVPPIIKGAIRNNTPLVAGNTFSAGDLQNAAASLTNSRTTVLQTNDHMPPNFSGDISGGKSWELGPGTFGAIFSASFGNTWRTRDSRQQTANDPNLASLQTDYKAVVTDNRAVTSGLLSLGYDVDRNKIRLTGLYIRDTLKQGRMQVGYNTSIGNADPVPNPNFRDNPPVLQQSTYWFERQLIDAQAVGEFHWNDLSLDVRGGYANSKRKSPYERTFGYVYSSTAMDYVNALSGQGQFANVAFSNLNEDVWAGGADLGYKLPTDREIRLTAGYAYSDTKRTASRYSFEYFRPGGALPLEVSQERPDYLVSDYNIYSYNIQLRDNSGQQGTAAYEAKLRVQAGYGQVDAELLDGVRINAGVRYESGRQSVLPIGAGFSATRIRKNYWLPAGTVTWNFAENMQLRVAGSKTIARPQFRELAYQIYQDPEADRSFTGNPFLIDSRLTNAEGRFEWYPKSGERVSLAGFYKKIDNPIEQVGFFAGGGSLRTGFANAPSAELYGGEVEAIHYIGLDRIGGTFFEDRRLLISANYSYTQSKLKINSQTVVGPDLSLVPANVLFTNGAPLTGQSDHLVNLQIGFDNKDHLSQQTILVNYASKRVTNRGPISGAARQPDIYERPGVQVDLVLREGVRLGSHELELKLEARNLAGRRFREYQKVGNTEISVNTYNLGRILSFGGTMKF